MIILNMAEAANPKNSLKTSWIHIDVSAPIIVFVALPIIFLSFCYVHKFANDYITCVLLSLTGLDVIVFIYLVIFKPENLTIDGRGHLAIKREAAKRNVGGSF